MPDRATIQITDAGFRRDLATIERETGKTGADIVREQASILARDLAYYTPPFDGGLPGPPKSNTSIGNPAQKKKGRAVVEGDIDRAVSPVDPKQFRGKLQTRLAKLLRRQKFDAITAIFGTFRRGPQKGRRVKPLTPADHAAARNARGRVKDPGAVAAASKTKTKKYTKRVQERVGMAKAVFGRIHGQLAGSQKRIPAWVKPHLDDVAGRTSISYRLSDDAPSITIKGQGRALGVPARKLQGVAAFRAKQMEARIRHQARQAVRQTRTLRTR